MADVEGKKLTELRVIDLKTELERRGLDKTGNKAALLERLSKAISDEGGNPEECLIVPCGGVCKTSPRKNSITGLPNQEEPTESAENPKEESSENSKSDLKSEGAKLSEDTVACKKEIVQAETQNNFIKEEEVKQEVKAACSRTSLDGVQSAEKKENEKTTVMNQTPTMAETNGIDNEDSINLTIGEDEESLLVEETESHDRHKDGGDKKKVEENKKGDSKGSGRAEAGANNKEGTASGANVGKNKQDGGDGGKRLVSHQ